MYSLTTKHINFAQREKVVGLTNLGEMKWRYRVLDEGETPRGAAIAALTKANDVIDAHVALRHQHGDARGTAQDLHVLELEWASELTSICKCRVSKLDSCLGLCCVVAALAHPSRSHGG